LEREKLRITEKTGGKLIFPDVPFRKNKNFQEKDEFFLTNKDQYFILCLLRKNTYMDKLGPHRTKCSLAALCAVWPWTNEP